MTIWAMSEKAELSRAAGADEVILYTESDFEAETKRLTDGRGVDVVYDSVGKTTFEKSLNCLRPRGLLALFGGSSGAVPPTAIHPAELSPTPTAHQRSKPCPHFWPTETPAIPD